MKAKDNTIYLLEVKWQNGGEGRFEPCGDAEIFATREAAMERAAYWRRAGSAAWLMNGDRVRCGIRVMTADADGQYRDDGRIAVDDALPTEERYLISSYS